MRTPLIMHRLVLSLAVVGVLVTAATVSHAGRYAVSAQANVRVWVEGGDVFDDYADVAIWLQPERDCYTTLFMVDTDGYMHVLYPSAPYHDTWLYGGRSYCYRARDLGLDRLDGAGIAYVFAVGSPVPFDYSVYGAGVFVGGFGFRVYGDPFVACRDFYMTMLPASCRWDYVGVSYARFYVRHWVRYPSYLCYGGPGVHVYVGDGCRACGDVYVSYRNSCSRPWDVFQPVPKFKHAYAQRHDWDDDRGHARASRVERVQRESFKGKGGVRSPQRASTAKQFTKPSVRSGEYKAVSKPAPARVETRPSLATRAKSPVKYQERARVVSTSSARERASVDKADVAAMTKQSSRAVRPSRSSDAAKRTGSTKGARTESSREKGTKKKQAL
ncbi:MAG: DUF4384 domain-containing protein [Candidatus Latescibacteria bacterium]|nr:DUF4384 domain-containing protein [Candidatus Latescibacterota bacterium]